MAKYIQGTVTINESLIIKEDLYITNNSCLEIKGSLTLKGDLYVQEYAKVKVTNSLWAACIKMYYSSSLEAGSISVQEDVTMFEADSLRSNSRLEINDSLLIDDNGILICNDLLVKSFARLEGTMIVKGSASLGSLIANGDSRINITNDLSVIKNIELKTSMLETNDLQAHWLDLDDSYVYAKTIKTDRVYLARSQATIINIIIDDFQCLESNVTVLGKVHTNTMDVMENSKIKIEASVSLNDSFSIEDSNVCINGSLTGNCNINIKNSNIQIDQCLAIEGGLESNSKVTIKKDIKAARIECSILETQGQIIADTLTIRKLGSILGDVKIDTLTVYSMGRLNIKGSLNTNSIHENHGDISVTRDIVCKGKIDNKGKIRTLTGGLTCESIENIGSILISKNFTSEYLKGDHKSNVWVTGDAVIKDLYLCRSSNVLIEGNLEAREITAHNSYIEVMNELQTSSLEIGNHTNIKVYGDLQTNNMTIYSDACINVKGNINIKGDLDIGQMSNVKANSIRATKVNIAYTSTTKAKYIHIQSLSIQLETNSIKHPMERLKGHINIDYNKLINSIVCQGLFVETAEEIYRLESIKAITMHIGSHKYTTV